VVVTWVPISWIIVRIFVFRDWIDVRIIPVNRKGKGVPWKVAAAEFTPKAVVSVTESWADKAPSVVPTHPATEPTAASLS
jgi:hypothetical protein